jgi:hypothetical protein
MDLEEVKRIVNNNKGVLLTGEYQDWHHVLALQNQQLHETLSNKLKNIGPEQKNDEFQKMKQVLPFIRNKINENRTRYNDLFKKTNFQGVMSFLGRDSERQQKVANEQQRLDKENIELGRLEKDIQAQLPYYQTGGKTRKRRTKRIKRSRLR